MNTDYKKEAQDHLNDIAVSWEAPSDFWSALRKFSLDSFVLKDLIENAFIKGAQKGFSFGLSAGREGAFDLYSKIK